MFIAQLIVIQAITFIALVFVLRKIMYSASYRETKRLQELTQENTKKAQELAAKMEEAEKQYRNRIEVAEMEANKTRVAAKEESEKIKEDVLSKTRQEAERLVKQALNTKDKIKEELEAQLQQKCVVQSLALVQEVLSSKNMFLLHTGLVREALEEIGKIDPVKLKVNTNKGELIIADEITKADKEEIISILSAKTAKNILLEERKDKSLIAGITIKLGSLVIDGSLQGKLKEASEVLKK